MLVAAPVSKNLLKEMIQMFDNQELPVSKHEITNRINMLEHLINKKSKVNAGFEGFVQDSDKEKSEISNISVHDHLNFGDL